MRLIFIRHAEPDYDRRTLTEKGFREAQCLKDRILRLDPYVAGYYSSPLERALLTAAPAMEALNKKPVVCDWLKEFSYMIKDPVTGRYPQVPWDFMPQYWTRQELFYDRDKWYEHEIFRSNPDYEPAVFAMRKGLDDILEKFGYTRCGGYYARDDEKTENDDDVTLVFFAHLGAGFEALGYLTGISPIVLKQTFFMAPSSVTVLNAEKRMPGAAMFRIQVLGDTGHLARCGEPVSGAGAFSSVIKDL